MAHLYENAYLKDTIVPIADAQVSIASAAVLYGLSVYTVCRVSHTPQGLVAFRLHDHYRRLINSAHIIGLDTFEPMWSYQKFEDAVNEVLHANMILGDVFVRATVHASDLIPGVRSRGLTTTLSIFIYDAVPILSEEGVRLKTSVWRRVPDDAIPSRAKVNGAYVNSVLAKQDALDSGYDDCIFLDATGHVCELSAANIFMVREGVLITPNATSDVLEGITRRTVLDLATHMGIAVVERSIDLTELYIADEVFASGTSALIAPVRVIDGRTIGTGIIGPVTTRMRDMYMHVMQGNDPAYTHYLTLMTGHRPTGE